MWWDVAVVARAGSVIADAIRTLVVRDRFSQASKDPLGAGTALYDHDGRLLSYDEQAEQWFIEIGGPRWADPSLGMSGVQAVVSRAANVYEGRDWGPSTVRLRTNSRQWVTLRASVLRNAGAAGTPGPIALSMSRSVGWDVAPLLVEAFNLTRREQEVCQGAVRGLSNQDIADELSVSVYTVRDHLRAIFAKVGVTSRGELAARLFSDFYEPRLNAPGAEVVHVEY